MPDRATAATDLARAAIAAHRASLVRRFGFTELDIDVHADAGTIVLHGRVLARRVVPRIVAVVQAAAPGLAIDASQVFAVAGPWRRLDHERATLLAAIPGDGRLASLATELQLSDGPVQVLAEHAGFALVRATDGTLGWTNAALGDIVSTPRLPAPASADPAAFVRAARSYLGTPYRLGGTTAAGIDCSGLVQRALRDANAGLVPRHSSDQLAIDRCHGPGDDTPGDLVFVWTSAEAPCHVGIADGAGAVLHASRHRGVVADPRADVLARASRAGHVPWASIVALQSELEGAAAIDDVLDLGRPTP